MDDERADPFDVERIDDLVHGRVRLGIMAYLAREGVASFTELKDALRVTQGTLSVHLRKLEEASYVAIDKSFVDRKPLTQARLTREGRAALSRYLAAIEGVLGAARPARGETDE